MSFRQFAFGLTATFGIAWVAILIVPFFLLRSPAPVAFNEIADNKTGIYFPKSAGRIVNGEQVYAANGCINCHTQLIRPTYAGNDLGRADWGGMKLDPERGDTRRESNVFDYRFASFAQIGTNRLGPDLSNVGLRAVSAYAKGGNPRTWFLNHLYNPRNELDRQDSRCPPFSFLFDKVKIEGQKPSNALDVPVEAGYAIVPTSEANELVDYLLSLKRDEAVPASMNYAPPAKPAAAAAAKKG
ncbi:MAG: cytochrome oxidase mono-heme subunit/FixO [Akkermansiaceae bacterium]|nr:cytochrome oxidase mono-heme subunit/FixO [Akkermansiaceae bacterium]